MKLWWKKLWCIFLLFAICYIHRHQKLRSESNKSFIVKIYSIKIKSEEKNYDEQDLNDKITIKMGLFTYDLINFNLKKKFNMTIISWTAIWRSLCKMLSTISIWSVIMMNIYVYSKCSLKKIRELRNIMVFWGQGFNLKYQVSLKNGRILTGALV